MSILLQSASHMRFKFTSITESSNGHANPVMHLTPEPSLYDYHRKKNHLSGFTLHVLVHRSMQTHLIHVYFLAYFHQRTVQACLLWTEPLSKPQTCIHDRRRFPTSLVIDHGIQAIMASMSNLKLSQVFEQSSPLQVSFLRDFFSLLLE